MAFVDDDGEAYLFFGYAGTFGGVMAGVLNPDMISWKVPPKLIANNANGLKNYLEGPFMFKRNGVYYLTWSNDNWQTPEYNVQYATAAHPLGPYTWKGRILEKDANSVGPGHHSILRIPGRDQWYIVYHRYNHTQATANVPRTAHIDTLRFNDDGSIRKVIMTDTGVRGVNLADALKPTEALRETAGSQGGIPGLRLACRSGEIELQSGSAPGRLELYDARGNRAAVREFPEGAKLAVGIKAGGAYLAEIRYAGKTYRRTIAAIGP
jgi:beta-xylosidase